MSQELKKDTIGELFMNLLQHMKCMEIRIDFAKVHTSQKHKYVINNALAKVKSGINSVCDLLGNSDMVFKIKKDLDKAELVYVMLLTEQLLCLSADDLQEITDMIEEHLKNKHGTLNS